MSAPQDAGIEFELPIQSIVAVGTLAFAVLAIWGEAVRAKFSGPKLEVTLHNPDSEPITVSDGTPARYYHLKVKNYRRWAPAEDVRVVLTRINKPTAEGSFPGRALSGPLQLTWQHPQFHQVFQSIGPDDVFVMPAVR